MRSIFTLFIFFIWASGYPTVFGVLHAQASAKPNIVLINTDDLGWRDLGVYGSTIYQTPNIDQLARRGMLFTRAYASAANCAPSRACMMTGLHTTRHGIYTVAQADRGEAKDRKLIPTQNTTILADSFTTIAELLHQYGYVNATMGKWHLGDDPTKQGFDINIAGNTRGGPRSYFSPYDNPDLSDGTPGEYLTDRITDEAIEFIRKNKSQKFFLYLPYFAIHTPLMARADLLEKYQKLTMPPRQENPVYAAMIEAVDENVGRLIDHLRQLGLEDNTLIIFTSDNGGIASQSSQAPLRAGKGSYYEGGIRVPLIVFWKNQIQPSSICDEAVTNLDFLATLSDIVGIPEGSYRSDGRSFLPLLRGAKSWQERALFWHFPIYLEAYNGRFDEARDTIFRTRPGTVMQLGHWKLHEYFEDGALELYHLQLDPGEKKDLSKIYPEQAKFLHAQMRKWRKNVSAPVPDQLNPEYISPKH
jgi:arylsulfatase A-like enzyme